MTTLTTTSWLIAELWSIQSQKLTYRALIAKLELELSESEIVKRINTWKQMFKEAEEKEVEIKNQWIKILQASWIDKFSANWVEVKLKTSIWRLVIENEDNLSDYIKKVVKTTKTIDKKAIKEDLKQWLIIEGVKIEQDVTLEISYS